MPVHIAVPTGEQVLLEAVAGASLKWHIGPFRAQGAQAMPIEVTLTTEEKCRLSITPMTPGGQPAQVDGAAHWSVEGDCTVEPIDDMSAWLSAGTALGDSTVTVAVDADLGQGVVPIGDTCLVHVQNPMAASVGLSAEPPVLKTA